MMGERRLVRLVRKRVLMLGVVLLLLLLMLLLLLLLLRELLMLVMLVLVLLLLRRPEDRHEVVELLLELRRPGRRGPLGHALARRHHLLAVLAQAMAAVAFAALWPEDAAALCARAVGARAAISGRDAAHGGCVWRRRRRGHCLTEAAGTRRSTVSKSLDETKPDRR